VEYGEGGKGEGSSSALEPLGSATRTNIEDKKVYVGWEIMDSDKNSKLTTPRREQKRMG